ncbi:MAG: hypothetical protein NXH95_11890 [Pseudomonadaceae bacterium]|nr:hypothetical protein [Pseudomonadaceae bacterium]
MRKRIIENLQTRFIAYDDLISNTSEDVLVAAINVPKHKTLAEHLWCVVGARESYAKALAVGQWQGFACSMSAFSQNDFRKSLAESSQLVSDAVEAVGDWTAERDNLLATLAEHEVMHEGQIIRHMYGLGVDLPGSWKWA